MSSPKSQDSDNEDFDGGEDTESKWNEREEIYMNNSSKFYSDDDDSFEEGDSEHRPEFPGIKEQMYQDKLAQLKNQLQQLRDGTHPEYNKKLKKIEATYKERARQNDMWRDYELECIERQYLAERKFAAFEFKEKKSDLKENLLVDLDEKKKLIEQERYSLDLISDSMEYKPVSTRKLRRRGNEPPPMVEKRRKPMTTSLQFLLEEKDVDDDLKLINKSKLVHVKKFWMDNKCSKPDLHSIDSATQRRTRYPVTSNVPRISLDDF